MKSECVLIRSVLMQRGLDVKQFQIKLPRIQGNIVSVEMSMQWISGVFPEHDLPEVWELPMQLRENKVIAELKLQSCNASNVFYNGEISVDRNLDFADFSTRGWTRPKIYSHYSPHFIEHVNIPCDPPMIQGALRNLYIPVGAEIYKYKVNIYLRVRENNSCHR